MAKRWRKPPVPVALHRLPWAFVRERVLAVWSREAHTYHLTGNSWLVLEAITRLQWFQARTLASHAAYAVPSEAWVAGELCLARETVSDAVQVLKAHGLLLVTRRRPVGGRWSTNLYRMAGAVLGALIAKLQRRGSAAGANAASPEGGALRVTRSSRVEVPAALKDLYDVWMARGGGLAPGGSEV